MNNHGHLIRDAQITLSVTWGLAISNLILALFHPVVGCLQSASILKTSIGVFYFTLLFDLVTPNLWSRKLLPTAIAFGTMLFHWTLAH